MTENFPEMMKELSSRSQTIPKMVKWKKFTARHSRTPNKSSIITSWDKKRRDAFKEQQLDWLLTSQQQWKPVTERKLLPTKNSIAGKRSFYK